MAELPTSDDVATDPITLAEVLAAQDRMREHVVRTPLVPLGDTGVLLKAESLQPVGSFKLRGAINSLLLLDDEQRRRGVVAHSSGNHAIAVAHAGAALGIAVTVVMPADAPAIKRERTEALGARVEVVGPASDERVRRAAALADEHGLVPIEPYDRRSIVAATAVIAVEILDDLSGAPPDAIYVPVSGGGLAAGVALAAGLLAPDVRVVSVEPEHAATFAASLATGRRVSFPAEQVARTAADGLRVQQVGALPWAILRPRVHEAVTVSEEQIAEAGRRIEAAGLAVEPSGAVATAGALAHRAPGSPVVAVVTGQNAPR